MKKFLLLFYFFILIIFFSIAQPILDSLEKVMKGLPEDSSKVDMLNILCWNYLTVNINKAFLFSEEAISLSKKIGYKKGLAKGYVLTGNIFYEKGELQKSIEEYHKGLKIREETGDKWGTAGVYGNIGHLYGLMKQFDKAIEYQQKSLSMFQQIEKENPSKDNQFSIAECLMDLGGIYKELKQYDSAMKNFQQALFIYEKDGYMPSIIWSMNEMGALLHLMGKNTEALEYDKKTLDISRKTGDKKSESDACYNLAIIYLSENNFDKAIDFANRSLEIAGENSNKENISLSYQLLSKAYEGKKDFRNAYENFKLHTQVKDSMFNEESSKQITEMQTKYETEKKEQQIKLLNKDKELQNSQLNRQKIIIWSVAFGLLIVVILSGFIFKERRKSEKLLLNILPVETAKELKAKGKAAPKYYENVTVMFTDFKGFTTIAEKLSAEELVNELDFIFKKFDEIISKHNIEKIKTIGDAYMCVSGLPIPNSNHAEEILKAGLEIQSWMKAQNNNWSLRIGIHSGPVTAGVVGDKKFAYDIWGDTVNVASRMESSCEAGKINISGATYNLMSHISYLNTVFRGKIPAKNKGDIEMYFVEQKIYIFIFFFLL
ncbi:MAG: tetratricopeptide repeat protein [Bacteroidetes bacterium]|nr:tetratricopeptide repeat protein [Bacteroidota bacterium]